MTNESKDGDSFAMVEMGLKPFRRVSPPAPALDEAREREAFEAWAHPYAGLHFHDEYLKRDGDSYFRQFVRGQWAAWMAAAKRHARGIE